MATTRSPRTFTCRVFGYPVPQGRPRFARAGRFVSTYDPPESLDWKRTVQAQVIAAGPGAPMEGPLALRLVFILLRPKSIPKKRLFPTVKPDVDNLVKAIKDAMSGVVYRDDAQIVVLYGAKEYGEQPGVDIEVRELMPSEAANVPTTQEVEQGGLPL